MALQQLDVMRFLLFLLFSTGCCLAQPFTMNDLAMIGIESTVAGCATTDTTIPHNTLLEGFQTSPNGTNDGNSVVVTLSGTTANITTYADTASLTSGKPSGACSRAIYFDVPTTGTETFATWVLASPIDVDTQPVNITFYIYVVTIPDDAESYRCFTAGTSSTPSSGRGIGVQIFNSSGSLILRGEGGTASANITITANAWHKVVIHAASETAGSLSTIAVDDGAARTFDRNANDLQYFHLGAPYLLDANESGQFYIDLICVDQP